MASSTVPAFLTTLRTNLALRAGLSGVRVDLIPTGDTSSLEAIILVAGKIQGGQAYEGAAMGRRLDSYTIPARIDAKGTGPDSDTNFITAMNRAAAILDEVIQEVRDNKPAVGNVTTKALITDIGYTPVAAEDGGIVAICSFDIEYEAFVT